MRIIFTLLLFIYLAGLAQPLSAQLLPLKNYTVQNSLLPSNTIKDIEQDKQGYIWLATQVGAVKFDGYNFKLYSSKQGIPDKNITDILIASDSSIWLGTDNGGIAIIHHNKVRVINKSKGLVSNKVSQLFEDKEKKIWCATDNGVSVIGKKHIVNFNASNSPLHNNVLNYYVDHGGQVWLATSDGVYTYKNGKLGKDRNEAFNGTVVSNIIEDNKRTMWFATQDKGVVKIDKNHKTSFFNTGNGLRTDVTLSLGMFQGKILVGTYYGGIYEIADDKVVHSWCGKINDFAIMQFVEDTRGRIWIRTFKNGILLMVKGKIQFINHTNGLVNDIAAKIFLDSNQDIWFATFNGLSMYGKVIFQIYKTGLVGNELNIFSVKQINKKIYLGTYAGLNILDSNDVIQHYPLNESEMSSTTITSINKINNCIWLGMNKGLIKICDHTSTYIRDNLFYANSFPISPNDLEPYKGAIICATQAGLISYRNKKFSKLYLSKNQQEDWQVWSIKKGPENKLWCASVDGLLVYNGKTFDRYTTEDGLPSNYCMDLDFDPDSNIWLATDNGVSRINILKNSKIKCKNFGIKEGLVSENIFLIISDMNGYTWAGHNKGLERIDQHNFAIKHYGKAEGFLPVETSLGAATISENGDIWFGTVEGAVKYIPSNDIENTDPPKTYITSVSLLNDNTPVKRYSAGIDSNSGLPKNLQLPYFKNNLIFKFVGLHYTAVEKNQYRYKLDGFDADWSRPGYEIQALYRKIPPGKYTFKLLASNCDGVWTKKPVSFSFEIKPPFYRTWWFYLLEAMALIATLIIYIRLRERKLRRDKQILSQRVKERTIEVEKQRDQIAQQKEEITDSIHYAQKIQSAVLPKTEVIDALLPEYFILYKPRDIVSGDFYWINSRENKMIVVAADCTGHGVPGAFMSMLGVSILNETTSSAEIMESGKILDTLRSHLTSTLWQTGKEEDAKDGMDMALCIIDKGRKKLQFSGAYNPLVLIRKGEIILTKGDKMPVGFHLGGMPPFTTHEIELENGDCLYIYSDGYEDQFGGPEGKKFKAIPFRDLLLKIHEKSMKEQKEILDETFMKWMGINEQVDDILVIGIRV